jgi:hypothetical protein
MNKVFGILLVTIFLQGGIANAGGGRCPGGGEMPGPFGCTNIHAELADGELYDLEGQVVMDPTGNAYLMIDLDKQEWLASAERQKSPYYPLEGNSSAWRQLNFQTVLLTAKADASIVKAPGGAYQQVISLHVLQVRIVGR